MVFYDLQDLTQDSFEYKRRHNQNQSEKTEAGKTIVSPNSSIPQTQENTTKKYPIAGLNARTADSSFLTYPPKMVYCSTNERTNKETIL